MRLARAYPNLSPRPNARARRVADACANPHAAPNPNARAYPGARLRARLVHYANPGRCARLVHYANPGRCARRVHYANPGRCARRVHYANPGRCARLDARANPNPRRANADGHARPRGDARAAPDRNADAHLLADAYARLRSGRRRRRRIHV